MNGDSTSSDNTKPAKYDKIQCGKKMYTYAVVKANYVAA